MDYISTKDAAIKFGISDRRVQKLCESGRIPGSQMISGVWLIPSLAEKPVDERYAQVSLFDFDGKRVPLSELCKSLSISVATGKNWIKLGKLIPNSIEGKTPFFTEEYISAVKRELIEGKNSALKSRRNKKYVSGNEIYRSYVTDKSSAITTVQHVLSKIKEYEIKVTDKIIAYLLAECAIQLISNRIGMRAAHLTDYLNDKSILNDYALLVSDFFSEDEAYEDEAYEFVKKYSELFISEYTYEDNEDILGLLYISLNNLNNRKATGAYYTPTAVVNKLIKRLERSISLCDKDIIDPCCGTGNFLLQLPSGLRIENIHGSDIDERSVKIARINIALKYNNVNTSVLFNNIRVRNYLFDEPDKKYDVILGNPPWGFDFSEQDKEKLRKKYQSAVGKSIESYNVFIEQALSELHKDGILAFVLPEAILNVKAHSHLREILISHTSIQYLEMLGNAFDKVQCPCIIMQIIKTNTKLDTKGMTVNDGKQEYTISKSRIVSANYFSFQTTDEEYEIIKKIDNPTDKVFIANNCIFALGIVTGNNKEYITQTKEAGTEMVLKGSDIYKYKYHDTDNYIKFVPESFQQVAPTEYYRAKEKLLYRFICNQPVFAYDDKQILSLNSCNILIPTFKNLSTKYVLAVLNSSIAQFYFKKQFNSVKVLRSHIEQIPIPNIGLKEQGEIIEKVDMIFSETNDKKIQKLYYEIDSVLSNHYSLTFDELLYIQSQNEDNIFLI